MRISAKKQVGTTAPDDRHNSSSRTASMQSRGTRANVTVLTLIWYVRIFDNYRHCTDTHSLQKDKTNRVRNRCPAFISCRVIIHLRNKKHPYLILLCVFNVFEHKSLKFMQSCMVNSSALRLGTFSAVMSCPLM